MKDRGTYLLLTLFFASLLGLWVADFARVPTRAGRERVGSRVLSELLDTKPDDLRKVEILGGKEGPIVFERRSGNRWQMTAPIDVAADPSKVETLAYNLKELSRRPESATMEGDPAKYGLAPPERSIKLWGEATAAPLATLEVGISSLDRRYVRGGGSEGIEVVEARGLDLLRLAPVAWRDRELFRVPSFEVDALEIASAGKSLSLKRGRGAWHVVEPFRVLAADARVDGLIADLGSLRVLDDTRFIADDVKPADLERYGLKTPALTIEVDSGRTGRRRDPQVLHVGKPVEGKADQVYARRGDQDDVVIVEGRILKDLRPEANLFRSPKVADITLPLVVRVGVEDGEGNAVEAVRLNNNDWAIASPSPARGDRQAIQEFLKALDQLQTGIFLGPDSLPDSGLDKPSMTLKVWQARDPREPVDSSSSDSKGDLAMVLRIGRRDLARKSIFARVEGDPTILVLPDTANSFLPRNPLAFRDRQVLGLDVEQIEQFQFIGPNRKITLNAPIFKVGRQNMGLAPPGWWMVEPVEAPADAASMEKLLKLLGNLRAESLVTERPDGLDKYGLKAPSLTLTWAALPAFPMARRPSSIEKGRGTISLEEHSLIVGAAVPDRPNARFAKLGDSPLIFTIGQDVLGTLDAEWRDRRVMAFDADRVRKIRLDWPDRGLSLARDAEKGASKWSLGSDQDAPDFDLGPIESLVQAASKLTTTRFAQYIGPIPPGVGLDPARLTIRLDFEDGSPPRTLRIGVPAGRGQVFATTEDGINGAVFLLGEAPFAPIMKAPLHGDLPDNVFAP